MNLVAYNVLPTWKKLHLFNIHSYHYEKNPKHRLREDGKGKGRREEGVRTEGREGEGALRGVGKDAAGGGVQDKISRTKETENR